MERQTFRTLSLDSGLSIDTLQRTFYTFLEQSPAIRIIKRQNVNLRLDATYFEKFCLVCYQDHEDGYTQLIRFTDGEHYPEIKEDLDNLIKLGVQIESVTSDGHKSILKAKHSFTLIHSDLDSRRNVIIRYPMQKTSIIP